MKDLKIFAIVVAFTLALYIGVEPFAHSQMHKHVEGQDFKYEDINATGVKGNAANGKNLIAACVGCHAIKSQGMKAPMDAVASADAYGVNPPDLSLAGALYDEKFLIDFVQNPTHATHTKHLAMPPSASSPQDAADIVAYLKSIAPKAEEAIKEEASKIVDEKIKKLKSKGIEVSADEAKAQKAELNTRLQNKNAFEAACGRCHAMRYAKWTQIGTEPKGKKNIKTGLNTEVMKFKIDTAHYQGKLADYMGKLPPDLSIIIRARSEHFLETFVEDPQTQLPGTAMPRVGLTKEGYEKVKSYLEEVGDPSASKRAAVGPWVIGFFVIFTLLAFGWYKSQWKGLK